MKLLICLFLFLAAYAGLFADTPRPGPITDQAKTILEAEKEVFFDDESQRLIATPNARLSSGSLLLVADRIEYDRNKTMAFARGQVTLTDGTLRLLAREMEINLSTGDFQALEVKAGFRTQFGIPAIDFRPERKLLLGKRRHLAGRKSEDWKASFSIRKDRSKPLSLWSPRRQKRSVGLVPWNGRRLAAFRISTGPGRTDGL